VDGNKQEGPAGRRGCLGRGSGMEGPVDGTPEAVVQGAFDALRQWHGMKKDNGNRPAQGDAQHASHAAGSMRNMPAAPPDSGVFHPGGGFRRCPLPPSAGHRLRTGGSIRREACRKRLLLFADTDSFAPKSQRQTLFAAAPRSWMADRFSRTVTSCSCRGDIRSLVRYVRKGGHGDPPLRRTPYGSPARGTDPRCKKRRIWERVSRPASLTRETNRAYNMRWNSLSLELFARHMTIRRLS
jgi:hypothetical protein